MYWVSPCVHACSLRATVVYLLSIAVLCILSSSLVAQSCDLLFSDSFENNYGNWIDGGSDCSRVNNANRASDGTYSVRIRDNSSTAHVTSQSIDASTASEIRVSFAFEGENMNNGHDFWLQLSTDGGASYTTIETWVAGVDFNNNVSYLEQVLIPGPFTSNTRLRFRCDAATNDDRIYLDEIDVELCSDVFIPVVISSDQSVCSGGLVEALKVTEGNENIAAYQWQMSTTSCTSGFADIPGATDSTYTPTNVLVETYFRVVVDRPAALCATGSCSDVSNCITISIRSALSAGLLDQSVCKNSSLSINAPAEPNNHSWAVLASSTASGYSISGENTAQLSIDADGASLGFLDIRYEGLSTEGCNYLDTFSVFILPIEPCDIVTERDTICSATEVMLDATVRYDVYPESGAVLDNQGDGVTVQHEIIGVQDPTAVTVTITLPTWDDHFDQVLLNGQQILPKVLETASYNAGGMNCQTPWIENQNGLPRSIIIIEGDEVRYFSSLTTTATTMTEVFPTNWITTPQPFQFGANTLQFGIRNTAGPTSGNWFIEATGVSGYSYLWSTGDTTPQITILPTESATYSVQVTSPNGCISTCDKTIAVINPVVEIPDTNVCLNSFIDITPIAANEFYPVDSHQWTILTVGQNDLTIINENTATTSIATLPNADGGVVDIEYVRYYAYGCEARDTFTITVDTGRPLSCQYRIDRGVWLDGQCDLNICIGDLVELTVDGSAGAVSWTGPNGFTSTSDTLQLIVKSEAQLGQYVATVNGQSSGNCGSGGELTFSLSANQTQDLFYADFESGGGDNNWSLMQTASEGNWTQGSSNGYTVNGFLMERPAPVGSGAFYTGVGFGEDVDNGLTMSRSRDIVLTGDSIVLELDYYFAYYYFSFNEYMSIDLVRSADDQVLTNLAYRVGQFAPGEAEWLNITEDISSYSGETVYIRTEVYDEPTYDQQVEGALDEVRITSYGSSCICPAICEELSYAGCEGDGYSITINGNIYNEQNPDGIELLTTPAGCDSIVTIALTFDNDAYEQTYDYVGCAGDGYSITVNGTTYNEANPTGVEVVDNPTGCDTTYTIDLVFNPEVEVEAGMLPHPICSNQPIDLTEIGAYIQGGTNRGLWSTMGDGSFNNGGVYNISGYATEYVLGPEDIESGTVILTLTSVDPPGPCEPAADPILITISDLSCSEFPWVGN